MFLIGYDTKAGEREVFLKDVIEIQAFGRNGPAKRLDHPFRRLPLLT